MWWSALIGGFLEVVGSFVGRVLVSLGISAVVYTGLDTSMTWLRDQALNGMTGLGADFIAFVGVMQVGTAINIIASAYAARWVLAGMANGAKRVLKT